MMQLKPEYEVAAFENVFSMSGMPDHHHYDNNTNNGNEEETFEGMRSYLQEEKTGSLKRGSEDDGLESNTSKRAKTASDYAGFQQQGMAQFPQGMGMGMGMDGNNLFVSSCVTNRS